MRTFALLPLMLLIPAVKSPAFQLTINTFAGDGSGTYAGDGGTAQSASLNDPVFVASDAGGNVYIADQNNNRIRVVNTRGIISTFAGNGTAGFSGDGGPATAASLNSPTGVFADGYGNVYVADVGNQRIRKIDQTGTITTVAGNGVQGFSGEGGPPTAAAFYNPVRVITDNNLNIYIADQSNHRVRKVYNGEGVVTTIAGTGSAGFSGDGGPATAAELNNPTALAFDINNNLYIADQFNQRIRKVDTKGNITTVAGNGSAGFAGDGGEATAASLNYPGGLIIDTSGNIFLADDLNFRVRKISASGIITTVAGNGVQGFSGDGGSAMSANLNGQFGVAVDPSGNLLISDSANNRIRIVDSASSVTPIFQAIGVTNGASFVSGGSAGALGTIFGVHLSVDQSFVVAIASPLPTELGGTTVTINGFLAPLNVVVNSGGSEQINFQMPWEVAGQPAVSVVVNNGVSTSAAVSVPIFAAQPGIFSTDGVDGAIEHLNGSVVSPSNPAAPGEYVVVFATGLGPVSPALATGQATPIDHLTNTTFVPSATIAGLNANIVFSGEAPIFVGLNQINLQVPAGTPSGSQDLVLSTNGVSASTVKIAIQ